MKLKIRELTSLQKLPAGSLFLTVDKKTLGVKTEYRTKENAIEAYIVGSGEFFWGGTDNPDIQNTISVYRVKVKNNLKS